MQRTSSTAFVIMASVVSSCDFISMALHGNRLAEVIKMIDDLVAELKRDQVNDDSKKEYCCYKHVL